MQKFEVSDVKPKIGPLKGGLSDIKDEMKKWILKNGKPVEYKFESGETNYPLMKSRGYIKHGLIDTVYTAYCEHRPLELSADDFWVMITHGIAKHLNQHAEKYRNQFVDHAGQKNLSINVQNIGITAYGGAANQDKWPIAIANMRNLVKTDMKSDFAELMTKPFSTTGFIEQTVIDCSLLESVKSYYKYYCCIECGIPYVILHGTSNDFKSMIDRIEKLKILLPDLNWWFDSFLPHLDKLKQTAEGNADIAWWQTICHPVGGGSDISLLAGWLADFIPYVDNNKGTYDRARTTHHHYTQGNINGIAYGDLMEAVTSVDFILDNNGHEINMVWLSGFMGISQNNETGALRPAMGWATAYVKK